MDESSPPPIPPAPSFRDRRSALIVFGIVQILLGALAALMVPFMFLGQAMAARLNQEPAPVRQLIPGMVFYIIIAALLIGTGIGSCKARRWARALSLIVGWSWLALGVLSIGMMVFLLPDVLKNAQPQGQQLPQAAMLIGMIVALIFMSVLMILVPGMLVFFYRSPHVRATCEMRDPSPSWTDACPLPVLGLSLWLGLAAVGCLAMPLSTHGVLPLFGKVLSGVLGSVSCVIFGVLWGYCAWATYRLRPAGWWMVLTCLCIVGVSACITFARLDITQLYRDMGYSQRQIDSMRQFGFVQGHLMAYMAIAWLFPALGYVLFVKRYFCVAGQAEKSN